MEKNMWERNTAWFDLAVILAVFAFGNVLFGKFEQHRHPLRRVLKVILLSALYVWIAQGPGRPWAYGLLAIGFLAAAVIHGWWLPKHGINGLTAEPYDKYLELVTRRGRHSDRDETN
jgi:hypothetical protein